MTVINTTSGRIRGEVVDGIHRFRSVPYAAAPVGELRFAAPRPSTWDGERDATKPGPIAPQVNRSLPGLDLAALISNDGPQGGDFLTVDVHTPDPAAGSLPVMVFIHGGAFVGGTGTAVLYDGRGFARRGVVIVTINYRLGVDGFLALDGGDTNNGLRDQIAALHWVRDNAAVFGGNPDNITVFGESAGGVSVACLLGSPLARGLFRRAIVESGHSDMVRDPDRARKIAEHVAAKLGVSPTAEAFRGFTTEQLLAAQMAIATPGALPDLRDEHGVDPLYGMTPFCPVLGDDVLPAQPRESLNADVDLLAGFNAEEMKLYFVPTGVLAAATDEMALALLSASRPDAAEVLGKYGLGQDPAGEVLSRALTDLVFADGVRRLLAEHPGRKFGYRFEWRSPQFDGQLGACHGLEMPFVFDNLAIARELVGPDAPRELAAEMNAAWVRFAETGDPGWEAGVVKAFG
ncbi:carboxylesterase/lipase family protein [Kutzneria sp. CA-103260]|uniref:carboxylesterase/lipase family protein n=1 Tax=Kutzneria sp. CA-103260 TaxID=2802641 RepID=UPI001BAC8551|nr:carboxylesterase family protein [Kutzneria sp. CA-103260]QUQ66669.1 carboxylesterase type B [Kutzneria sp. CA-103260]